MPYRYTQTNSKLKFLNYRQWGEIFLRPAATPARNRCKKWMWSSISNAHKQLKRSNEKFCFQEMQTLTMINNSSLAIEVNRIRCYRSTLYAWGWYRFELWQPAGGACESFATPIFIHRKASAFDGCVLLLNELDMGVSKLKKGKKKILLEKTIVEKKFVI